MDAQQILNFCVKKIVEQGVPSIEPGDSCRYRGPNGTKCAIGHLIDDAEYKSAFEGITVRTLFRNQNFGIKNVDLTDFEIRNLLVQLQDAHDNAAYETVAEPSTFLVEFEKRIGYMLDSHDFRELTNPYMNGTEPILVCRPMHKFFNLYENPSVMNLDLNGIDYVMDKLDGSLISTAALDHGKRFTLKSKTSFNSEQARAARALLQTEEYSQLNSFIASMVGLGFTVNMEYCSPNNRIVIGYEKPMLRILNIRNTLTGSYFYPSAAYFKAHDWLKPFFVERVKVKNPKKFIEGIPSMTGIEGFIAVFKCGTWVKIKTEAYQALHKTKDSVTNPRALFEVCLNEGADDLISMFHTDELAVKSIRQMQEYVANRYNHLSKTLDNFYQTHKNLDRKSYAILGQELLKADGVFSLAMNMYLGRDVGLKEWMIKNYQPPDFVRDDFGNE